MVEDDNLDGSEIRAISLIAAMANEYKRLALLPELNDKDAGRMDAILEWAMYDESLHAMIAQVDIEVAKELEENE